MGVGMGAAQSLLIATIHTVLAAVLSTYMCNLAQSTSVALQRHLPVCTSQVEDYHSMQQPSMY